MRLRHLSLTHFRTYYSLELDFPPGPILLHGQNAQGKTSLLEAIYYLATAQSPHTTSDRQLINWLALNDAPTPFAKIVGEVEYADEVRRLEVRLILDPAADGQASSRGSARGASSRGSALSGSTGSPCWLSPKGSARGASSRGSARGASSRGSARGASSRGSALSGSTGSPCWLSPKGSARGAPVGGALQGARLRKEVYVNSARKTVADFRTGLCVVLFLPQDLALIEGSPSERRRYIDQACCQVDAAYCHALAEYHQVITQRNALLRQMQERGGDPDQLDFWDARLVEHGATLIQARARALDEIERLAGPIHRDLTAGADPLRIDYRPSFDPLAPPEGQLELGLNVPVARSALTRDEIRARLTERLTELRAEDVARGQTTIGPHRDEIRFSASGVDLGVYGSRGQGRTAVLALKLAEMEWMRGCLGEWPVLLLDEVLAELDETRRRDLLNRINGAEQAVMTTADLGLFTPEFRQKAAVWRVEGGRILN